MSNKRGKTWGRRVGLSAGELLSRGQLYWGLLSGGLLSKAVMYNKRPKMKRDTQQKSSLFPSKRTAFLLGISFHFWPFVFCKGL